MASANTLPVEHELLPTTIENPLVRKLVDTILNEAAMLAKSSSEFTASQLLQAAKFYVPGELKRINTRQINPWNLAIKYEKANAPPDILNVEEGTGHQGRSKLTGGYQKWLATRWKTEPELKEKYQKMADSVNTFHSSENGNSNPDNASQHLDEINLEVVADIPPLTDMKKIQMQSLNKLSKLVSMQQLWLCDCVFVC
jgi:hypothetical protein